MPLIDLPLEKLREYAGRNPKPADFDAYWDRGLAEMKAIDAAVELKPGPLQPHFADCSHLFFTGVGGARVHAKLVRPKGVKACGSAVVFFHGYTGASPAWVDLLSHAAHGHVVAALDCRGQGGLSEDLGSVRGNTHSGHIIRGLAEGPEKLLYRSIFLDTAQLAGIVMKLPDVDAARVGSTGGSQGGALAIACAALEPRIARCAPMYPFLSDYLRVWEMDQAKDAFDPNHGRIDEWFRRLGYIDIQFLAPRIRAKVMLAVGLMDTVCPPSTQFAAYNRMTCEKELVIYPDFGHETLPGWTDKVFGFMAGL
jgi:cephalosporin-C deacetylase